MARPQPTDGARMVYLIKRKTETTREEIIAHWFANHMPGIIARNDRNRASGAAHAPITMLRHCSTLRRSRTSNGTGWRNFGIPRRYRDRHRRAPWSLTTHSRKRSNPIGLGQHVNMS